jgi:hypothetical protein
VPSSRWVVDFDTNGGNEDETATQYVRYDAVDKTITLPSTSKDGYTLA